MALQLDGGNTIIGTYFIKLLATGSSNLATENYVDTAVANGGGGGGGDLTNYYDKTEVDNLLVNKLNKDNPQDMSGTLRIGHVAGTSEIILNALASDKDFYVNGDGQINGTMTVLSSDSSGYVKGSSLLTNTFNANNTNDIIFNSNGVEYARFDVLDDEFRFSKDLKPSTVKFVSLKGNFISNNDSGTDLKFQINSNDFMTFSIAGDKIEIDKDVELHSSRLKSNILDTWNNTDLTIKRNNIDYIQLGGTGLRTRLLTGCQSDIYDSLGNSDATYRRNGIDFFYLRNNQLELNTGIDLLAPSEVKTNVLNSNGLNDVVFKRNDVSLASLRVGDFRTETGINIISKGEMKCNIFNSNGDSDVSFRRNGTEYLLFDDNPFNIAFPAVVISNGLCLITEKVFSDEIRNKNNNQYFLFYGGNSTNNGRVNYLTYRPASEDLMFYRDVNVDIGYKLITPTLTSGAGANLAIQRGGFNYMTLGAGQVQLSTNITLTADAVVSDDVNSIDCYANTFNVKQASQDLVFNGSNVAGNGRINFMTYRRLNEDLMMYRNVNLDTGYKMITNTISSPDATNLSIERGGVNYMNLQTIEFQ